MSIQCHRQPIFPYQDEYPLPWTHRCDVLTVTVDGVHLPWKHHAEGLARVGGHPVTFDHRGAVYLHPAPDGGAHGQLVIWAEVYDGPAAPRAPSDLLARLRRRMEVRR